MATITSRTYFAWLLPILVLLAFVGVTGAWQARSAFGSADDTGGGNIIRQVVYVVLAIAALAPMFPRAAQRLVSAVPMSMWVLFGWCAVTLAWSPVPDIGLRRLLVTVLIAFSCMASTRQVPPEVSISIIWRALVGLMLLSLATVILAPRLGIHQLGDPEILAVGSWRGVFYHKNILGAAMAFLVLLTLYKLTRVSVRSRWRLCGVVAILAIALVMLLMSGSKTSLALSMVCGALYLVLNAFRAKSGRLLVMITLLLMCGVTIAVLLLQESGVDVGRLLSNPALFTGRGFIWGMLWDLGQQNPLGGVGYQSVFQVGRLSALAGITGNSFYDTLSHAHNAYLELFVSIGVVGLTLALFAVFVAPIRVVMRLTNEFDQLRAFLLSVFAFVFMHSFLESGIVDRDRTTWLIVLLVYGAARSVLQAPRGATTAKVGSHGA